MSATAALSVYQGETLAFEISYLGNDGNPVPDLSGAATEIRLSSGQDAISGVVDDSTGSLSYEIPPTVTADWLTAGLTFQVWMTYQSGKVEMVVEGAIDVKKAL